MDLASHFRRSCLPFHALRAVALAQGELQTSVLRRVYTHHGQTTLALVSLGKSCVVVPVLGCWVCAGGNALYISRDTALLGLRNKYLKPFGLAT